MRRVVTFFSSIRAKFLLLILLLLSSVFLFLALYLIRSETATLRNRLLNEVRAFSVLATDPVGSTFTLFKDSGTARIDRKLDEFLGQTDTISNIAVADVSGELLYTSNENTTIDFTKADVESFETVFKYNENNDITTVITPYFESSGAHRFSVIYNVSNEIINKSIDDSVRSIIIFASFTLAATTILTYILINRFIILPVRQVSSQANSISLGNLDQEIRINGKDEIALLGRSVNKMADSLKANIADLKEVDRVKSEFMMITSHNLRTPLTIITGYLDSIKLMNNNPEKLQDALDRITISAKRLAVFSEDVLTISRFELGEEHFDKTPIKLGSFIEKIAEDFKPAAERNQHTFDISIATPDATIMISAPHIRSALWNLLDNADKFTPPGGTIRLIASSVNGRTELVVEDTGVGIAEEELPKLFTKFHRGTSTETYDFEGTGIGLYASKVIIERHGGKITAQSERGRGSTFTITLFEDPNKQI